MPFIIWQLWLFIAPGLYSHEKKMAVPFVFFCTIFFVIGAAFSHYIAFPWTWKFFLGWQTRVHGVPAVHRRGVRAVREDAARLRPDLPDADGRVLPRAHGMVTPVSCVRHTKYAVLVIFILAAVISPGTDVVSQCLMAGPMLGLYGLSILVAWVLRQEARRSLVRARRICSAPLTPRRTALN